jgi:hypothetical protein
MALLAHVTRVTRMMGEVVTPKTEAFSMLSPLSPLSPVRARVYMRKYAVIGLYKKPAVTLVPLVTKLGPILPFSSLLAPARVSRDD